jgi:hypothetical protein
MKKKRSTMPTSARSLKESRVSASKRRLLRDAQKQSGGDLAHHAGYPEPFQELGEEEGKGQRNEQRGEQRHAMLAKSRFKILL